MDIDSIRDTVNIRFAQIWHADYDSSDNEMRVFFFSHVICRDNEFGIGFPEAAIGVSEYGKFRDILFNFMYFSVVLISEMWRVMSIARERIRQSKWRCQEEWPCSRDEPAVGPYRCPLIFPLHLRGITEWTLQEKVGSDPVFSFDTPNLYELYICEIEKIRSFFLQYLFSNLYEYYRL